MRRRGSGGNEDEQVCIFQDFKISLGHMCWEIGIKSKSLLNSSIYSNQNLWVLK